MQKKIVLIGGPGTGKSSVLKQLKSSGFYCMEEISRQITIKAQEEGVEQLFLTEPILFSKLLHKGRKEQYLEASRSNNNLIFFDRGLPDIHAYLDYTKKNTHRISRNLAQNIDMIMYLFLNHGKKFLSQMVRGMRALKKQQL